MPSNPRNTVLALALLVNGSAGVAAAQEAAAPAPAPAAEAQPAAAPAAPTPTPAPAAEAAPAPAPADAPVAAQPAPAPAAPAKAAQAPAAPAQAEPPVEEYVEEIVVTGSRIPRKELTTAAPVTVLDKAQIEATGRTSIGEILQNLPEQSNAINTQYNNGGDGATRVNLRGLGTSRTLVLLNGRRHVAGGTGADSSVDLNAIPTVAIQRIEVLKDGGSAVYGSDAISGVVNIITRQDYSGTELRAFSGMSSRGDGLLYDLSLTTGQSTERGNILFSAGYYTQKDVFAGDRDFSYFDTGYDFASRQIYTEGSTVIPGGLINPRRSDSGSNAAWDALVADGGTRPLIYDPAAGWRTFRTSGVTEAGGDLYNYQPENYLVTPQNRAHVYSTGGLRLGSSARAFFEASYTNRQSKQQLAPEPLSIASEGLTLSANNVYNPFNRNFGDVRRRLVEFGTRDYEQDIDTFRIVTGVEGKVPEDLGPVSGWAWDLSFNYGRTQGVALKQGLLQRSRLAAAIGPSFYDSAGNAVCGTPENPIDECVPLNLFGGVGSITPEMANYLSYRGTARGYNQQQVVTANMGGELFRISPTARMAGLAFGYEHRREAGASIPDPLTAKGDTTGNKEAPTEGRYYVNEGYLELSVPIIGEQSAETGELRDIWEVTGAARAFSYNTFGSGMTYKVGTRVSPIPDITLRSTWSTAFRAPTVAQLYLGATDSFDEVDDPCSNRTPGTIQDQICSEQGVPAGFEDDRTQQRAINGGNEKLEPETAKILTVGAVLQPRFLKDVSLTADYYLIDVKDAISSIGTSVILNECYSGGAYCDLIQRDGDGYITTINDRLANVGGNSTGGLDLSLRYTPQTPYGRFGFSFDANWLQKFNQELSDGTIIEAKGNYDLGGVYTNWRANMGVNWALDPVTAGVNLRWLNGFKECESNDCSFDPSEGEVEPLSRQVEDYYTVDVNASYTWMTNAGNTTAQLGVNNLLDRAPARVVNGFLASSDASTYDYMGRYFYVRLSHEFY